LAWTAMVGHQQNRGTVSARIGHSKRIHSPVVVLPHNRTHLFPIAPESPALRKYSCTEATCRKTRMSFRGATSPQTTTEERRQLGQVECFRSTLSRHRGSRITKSPDAHHTRTYGSPRPRDCIRLPQESCRRRATSDLVVQSRACAHTHLAKPALIL
jgi:hypothetical protein